MNVNLALAVIAAESVDGSAERGRLPYFWPMAELVGFLLSETEPGSDDPAIEAIHANPTEAREAAAAIDAVVAMRARSEAAAQA